jgi:hypothetical protein
MSPSNSSGPAGVTGPGDRRARFVFLVLFVGLISACGPPRQRFAGTYESPEALTEAFLQALEAGDRPGLESLALSEQEYQLEVFPEMPVYGNIPPDFAWSQLEGKNLYGVSTTLHRHRGRAWDLEGIFFSDGATSYQSFRVHREPTLRLQDRETGETSEMVLFGSILEHQGRYKLLSLNIDR